MSVQVNNDATFKHRRNTMLKHWHTRPRDRYADGECFRQAFLQYGIAATKSSGLDGVENFKLLQILMVLKVKSSPSECEL